MRCAADNRLPEFRCFLGIGRTEYQDDTYQTWRTEMLRFVTPGNACGQPHGRLLRPSALPLAQSAKLPITAKPGRPPPAGADGRAGADGMLAIITPPSLYGVIPLHLKAAGLEPSPYAHRHGRSLSAMTDSARELNRIYASAFEEHQITVSTTLLARTAQNILAFRFALFSSRFGTVTTSTT